MRAPSSGWLHPTRHRDFIFPDNRWFVWIPIPTTISHWKEEDAISSPTFSRSCPAWISPGTQSPGGGGPVGLRIAGAGKPEKAKSGQSAEGSAEHAIANFIQQSGAEPVDCPLNRYCGANCYVRRFSWRGSDSTILRGCTLIRVSVSAT